VVTEVQNYVDGAWDGTPEVERRNPANTSEVVARSVSSTEAVVEDAVRAASAASSTWSATPSPARGRVLLDAAELLAARSASIAEDLVREEGKTRAEALGEVRRATDVLRYFGAQGWIQSGEVLPSGFPQTMVYTRREPLGVVGVVTPWNFPIAIPAWKIAPALAAGNAVVWKPAELTSLTASHLVRALADAGLPPGVLNLVLGRGSVAGEALISDENVAGISFTGSTDVGLHLYDVVSRRRARVQLEMGGKNALVVLADADIGRAAEVGTSGAFGLTGQACTATSRIYCTNAVLDEFTAAFVARSQDYEPGDGLLEGVRMGPVVSKSQVDGVAGAVQEAKGEGAVVICGGDEPNGLFYSPTVITGVTATSDIVRNEVFGPVVTIIGISGLDEGICAVNDSRYGLSAAICTRDIAKAQEFAARAQAGVVKVNRPTTGLDLNAPFGGVKDSSTNTYREQGMTAMDFYTWVKTVYLGHDS
jgi:alpha-ketoglutaric semialdehyde dehydrogenase